MSSLSFSMYRYVCLCSPSDAMRPPTIQSLELKVERMKVCLVRDCHNMSGGMCDNTLSMNSTKVQNPRRKMQVALLTEPKTPLESSVYEH